MPVYTANYDSGQSVCSTLSAYFDSQKTNRPCREVAKATPAIVEEIVPCKASDPDFGWESPAVRIRARDGSWDGFTDSEVLDGEHRGLRGWMSIYAVSIGEAAPGQYLLVFPNEACI